jgi:Tol biopolymer transport system component
MFLAVEVPAAHGGTFPGGNGLIVFAADQFAVDDFEIYTMNPDGSRFTQLTNTTGINRYPSWSPDGTKIVFGSNTVTVDNPTGDYEIYVMNADGSGVTQLTFNTIEDLGPSYSPDGTKIAFNRDVNDLCSAKIPSSDAGRRVFQQR